MFTNAKVMICDETQKGKAYFLPKSQQKHNKSADFDAWRGINY